MTLIELRLLRIDQGRKRGRSSASAKSFAKSRVAITLAMTLASAIGESYGDSRIATAEFTNEEHVIRNELYQSYYSSFGIFLYEQV